MRFYQRISTVRIWLMAAVTFVSQGTQTNKPRHKSFGFTQNGAMARVQSYHILLAAPHVQHQRMRRFIRYSAVPVVPISFTSL